MSDVDLRALRVGVVGWGEVGGIFSAALCPQVAWVGAWDTKLADPGQRQRLSDRPAAQGVAVCAGVSELCERADLVISAVTAGNTLAVARDLAAHLRPDTWVLDLNSASPGTKLAAARCIHDAGGRYVEAGVMTSVPPYGVAVPMLLGGPHAAALQPLLAALGLCTEVVSARLGVASATKMCRSVMIKGLEALVIESYTTARHYGVEDAMIATLQETFPGIDWQGQGGYFFSRVAQHGRRRAEEMREVANTVREAGFEPFMASAIAAKDDWMADQAQTGVFATLAQRAPWQQFADVLLAARPAANEG
jgi:3-hydroxyisobutyrate dehydrogenase-like beta-hydroxyacid dehydrogenase